MHIPDNEGKACDAVVRLLEVQTGDARTDIRHPEKDGVGPPVDLRLRLGAQEYTIEHTRIEPFENQIKTGLVFKQINDCIEKRLSDTLPGPAYYALHVPTDVRLPEKKEKRNQALNNFVEWIRKNAQYLHEKNSGRSRPTRSLYRSDDRIQGVPTGFDCAVELLRWPNAALLGHKPGYLGMKLSCPNDLEKLRIDRLRRAFSRKCPKLQECKTAGARTVLALESRDIALTNSDLIGNQISKLLAEYTDAPDEIYVVETDINPWWVWLMKRDDDYWPMVGMPQWGPPRPTPASFEEDELNDLTLGRGSKRL